MKNYLLVVFSLIICLLASCAMPTPSATTQASPKAQETPPTQEEISAEESAVPSPEEGKMKKTNKCQATLTLSQADSQRAVTVRLGEPFAIELETNPSTGYDWQVEQMDAALLRQGESEYYGGQSDLLGSPVKVALCFIPLKSGMTQIHLAYRRPWEKDVEPQATVEFTIKIVE